MNPRETAADGAGTPSRQQSADTMQSGSGPTPSQSVPRLHVLTPEGDARAALELVDAALAGGARCIQVRRKDVTDRQHLAFATAVVSRCRAAGATCLVNDRLDIALAAGADGVHLGADDLPLADVRGLVGSEFVVGGTARNPDDARTLAAAGADYLGVGPVYATSTKQALPDPIGVEMLAAVAHAVAVPVIGIAGITVERVPQVLEAGAHGVAVVGAVSDAHDPAAATRALLAALEGRA